MTETQEAKLEEKKILREEKKEEIVETAKEKKAEEKEAKKEDKKEKKKPKTEAFVKSFNAHISTKTGSAICKFIVGKKIDNAIEDLEMVIVKKKVVPMKGEIPHQKGKGIMSGRYPKNASEHFIKLLKSLSANANVNGLENPIIVEAFANIGARPFGRFGRIRRKRTHIIIIAKNKMKKEKK